MKHPHYKKPVAGLQFVDVYRVLALFGVTDPCIQHAVKKMLVAGGRGAKDISQDVQDAIDTLQRWQEMRLEDERMNNVIRNGNTGEHYTEIDRLRAAEAFNADLPVPKREPRQPRHRCQTCAGGHATHLCAAGT
jgi:hypothetical protein